MTKDQAIARAQRDANREQRDMAVLNLNQYSPLYVIREYDPRMDGHHSFVARVSPQPAA